MQSVVDKHTAPLHAKKKELLKMLQDSVESGQYAAITEDRQGAAACQ